MQQSTRKRIHAFLVSFQRGLSRTADAPPKLNFGAASLFFMRDGVSVVLDGDDAKAYHEVVEALLIERDKARHELVSNQTIETLLQRAIAKVASSPATAAVVTAAVEALRSEFHAPPSDWLFWFVVSDMKPPSRVRTFGDVRYQASSAPAVRKIKKQVHAFIDGGRNTTEQKRSFKAHFDSEFDPFVRGKVLGSVVANAVDKESAQRIAMHRVRASLDAISFFGSLLTRIGRMPSVDHGTEWPGAPLLAIKSGTSGTWPGKQGHSGAAFDLDALFARRAIKDLRVSLVSRLLEGPDLSSTEKRVLTALRWAGRAAGKARTSEQFLFYLVAIETLLLPPQKDSELTYRIKLRLAHLLGRKVKDRAKLFKRMGELYSTRSAIVHTGSQDVSTDDLSDARYLTLNAVLRVLRLIGRNPDLEDWFVKQALR
jgi:hypothetical protein